MDLGDTEASWLMISLGSECATYLSEEVLFPQVLSLLRRVATPHAMPARSTGHSSYRLLSLPGGLAGITGKGWNAIHMLQGKLCTCGATELPKNSAFFKVTQRY